MALLEILGEQGPLNLTQIASRLGVSKTAVFRMTHTLAGRDWVVKDADRSYRLGPALLGMAVAAAPDRRIVNDLRAVMESMHDATGETIHLTRLDGRHVVYVEQIVSTQPVRSVAVIGARSPAHCVSPGLAQLCHQGEEQLRWFLSTPLKRWTPTSITRPEELRARLDQVRDAGYAVNLGGYRADVGGVGSAVLDPDTGHVVAGLSVCAPVYRLKSRDLDDLGALVRASANDAGVLVAGATRLT